MRLVIVLNGVDDGDQPPLIIQGQQTPFTKNQFAPDVYRVFNTREADQLAVVTQSVGAPEVVEPSPATFAVDQPFSWNLNDYVSGGQPPYTFQLLTQNTGLSLLGSTLSTTSQLKSGTAAAEILVTGANDATSIMVVEFTATLSMPRFAMVAPNLLSITNVEIGSDPFSFRIVSPVAWQGDYTINPADFADGAIRLIASKVEGDGEDGAEITRTSGLWLTLGQSATFADGWARGDTPIPNKADSTYIVDSATDAGAQLFHLETVTSDGKARTLKSSNSVQVTSGVNADIREDSFSVLREDLIGTQADLSPHEWQVRKAGTTVISAGTDGSNKVAKTTSPTGATETVLSLGGPLSKDIELITTLVRTGRNGVSPAFCMSEDGNSFYRVVSDNGPLTLFKHVGTTTTNLGSIPGSSSFNYMIITVKDGLLQLRDYDGTVWIEAVDPNPLQGQYVGLRGIPTDQNKVDYIKARAI